MPRQQFSFNNPYYTSSDQGTKNYPPFGGQLPSLFTIVFVSGLIIFIMILLGREAFNWYIKHNAMIEELGQIQKEVRNTNVILWEIEKQLKDWKKDVKEEDRRKKM